MICTYCGDYCNGDCITKKEVTNRPNRITEVPPESPDVIRETEYCRKCGVTIPHGQSRIGRLYGHTHVMCSTCAEKNPSIVQLEKTRITLDFCLWIQASFDDLVEEINKGVKVFKASSSE